MKYSAPIHMNLMGKDEISHSIESANPLMLEMPETQKIFEALIEIN